MLLEHLFEVSSYLDVGMGGGSSLTKRERYKRRTALRLAAFGILLWSSAVDAAFGSFQDLPSGISVA
jgi:hypothetical protein